MIVSGTVADRLKSLGARLREERLRRNEAQTVFASRIGVSVPTICSLEKLGLSWGITGVAAIVEQVFSAVADWRKEFITCGIMQKDVERFSEIDDYLRR